MGKIFETIISRFDGGMVNDPRDPTLNVCQLSKHFDNFTKRYALTPYKDSEDIIAATQLVNGLQSFLMYGGNMFALGTKSQDLGYAYILRNTAINTGDGWGQPTNGEDSAGSTRFNLFIEYKGILYGYDTAIWSYNIGTTTFDGAAQALTATSITQGLIHSKNDILYIVYSTATNAYVMRKNGAAAFETTALTLPIGFMPTHSSEDGNYLAINGIMPNGKFMTYFWDMSATSWEDSKTIEWGEGTYVSSYNPHNFIMEKLDGYLVSVSVEGSENPKLVFRKSYGELQQKFREIPIDSAQAGAIVGGQKYNNRLFFGLNAASPDNATDDYTGIWSVGRNEDGVFTVNFDRLPNNDTIPDSVKGFIIVQDYVYISHLTGATYSLSKTNDQASYTAISIYESQKFNRGDSSMVKNLMETSLTCDKLPTDATATLKYRVDGATFWTTLLTISTADRLTEFINKAIGDYREIEWRIESYKGAVITGFSFLEEIIGKKKQ